MSSERIFEQQIDKQLKKNGEAELLSRAFLKPIEIVLKTWENQTDTRERNKKKGQLPYGIRQVLKTSISDNKYVLADFNSLPGGAEPIDFMRLRQNNWDNIISAIKSVSDSHIKLAICVCMYSEDKQMLQRTISGIKKNILELAKQGIPSHQIVVCVVMDGIEHVHPSIMEFIEEIEKQNGIYLGENTQVTNLQRLVQQNIEQLSQDQSQMINLNHLIFDDDYQDRKQRKFSSRIKEYNQAKRMIKRIEQLEADKKVTFDSLDDYIKPYFFKIIKQRHNDEYGEELDLTKEDKMKMVHRKYVDINSICRPIILQALSSAKIQCHLYFKTRQKLALLNAFRMPVGSGSGLAQSGFQLLQGSSNIYMNILFITKYSNGGKLSSHNWFLNGICQELKPEYSILMDVGLSPKKDAILKMINYMEKHQKVGGVCGYMDLRVQKVHKNENAHSKTIGWLTSFLIDLFDVQRAQQAQYHISHLVDKPFESIFNFIHVLPGAFSGYRMKALKQDSTKNLEQNQRNNSLIMKEYFESISGQAMENHEIKKTEITPLQAILKVILPDFLYMKCWPVHSRDDEKLLYDQNVYLAEDRTLCLGIYLNGYDLHYLPDAEAQVDPVKSLHGLLGQRKRWINGSFFAFQKVRRDLSSKGGSSFLLTFQMILLQLSNKLAFVAPAIFLFTIHLSIGILFDMINNSYGFAATFTQCSQINGRILCLQKNYKEQINHYKEYTTLIIDFICVMILLGIIFHSMFLTNTHEKLQKLIYGASAIYGVFSLLVYVSIGINLFENTEFEKFSFQTSKEGIQVLITCFTISILVLYLFIILIYLLFFRRISVLFGILRSLPAFIFHGSTFLNILNVYALCRIDDISWGTKGLDTDSNTKKPSNWRKIKILQVSKFIFWNSLIGYFLFVFSYWFESQFQFILILLVMASIFLIIFIKVVCGILYFLKYKLCCCASPQGLQNNIEVEINKDEIDCLYRRRVSKSLKSSIKSSIMNEVRDLMKTNRFLSQRQYFSKIYRPPSFYQRKQRNLHNSRISQIQTIRRRTQPENMRVQMSLQRPIIQEETNLQINNSIYQIKLIQDEVINPQR